MPHFPVIGQPVTKILRFSGLQEVAVRHLGLFYVCLDHPRRVFGGLCHCEKFGWNRWNSFDNIQVLVFCALGLKMPIHSPKWIFWWIWPTKLNAVLTWPPEGTFLCGNTSYDVWIIKTWKHFFFTRVFRTTSRQFTVSSYVFMPVPYWLCKVPLQRSAWQCHLNKYIFNNNHHHHHHQNRYSGPWCGLGASRRIKQKLKRI